MKFCELKLLVGVLHLDAIFVCCMLGMLGLYYFVLKCSHMNAVVSNKQMKQHKNVHKRSNKVVLKLHMVLLSDPVPLISTSL